MLEENFTSQLNKSRSKKQRHYFKKEQAKLV